MEFSQYITLPHLYHLLSSKAISATILGICFLFIFSMNLAIVSLFLISVLAIPFSLYMLFVLYKYEKIGWIAGFIIWIGISFLPRFFISVDNLFLIVIKYLPLIFFVLYAILLKEKVGEWIIEMKFERESNRLSHSKGDL